MLDPPRPRRSWIEARCWDLQSLTWDGGVQPERSAVRTAGIVERLGAGRTRSGARLLEDGFLELNAKR